jgi:hypothetical protein
MSIQALGYLGVGSDKLDDWTQFATNWLGMQAVDRGNGMRAFRMDDRKQRLVIDRALPEGQRYFGWEVADAAALADQRFVRALISFQDLAGNGSVARFRRWCPCG